MLGIICGMILIFLIILTFWSKYQMKHNTDFQQKMIEQKAKTDERNRIILEYKKQRIKYCPHCLSTDFQYAGQQTIGARDAKTKTQYSLNLNPLKPFTFVNSKEKVVKKAKSGYSYDEFVCLKCGKRFR